MDQRRRAERGDICTRKHYTQEKGRKTPSKLKTKVNKLKWKVPWTSRVKDTVPNHSGTQRTTANHDPHFHPHTIVPHSITYGSGRARAAVSVPNTSLCGRLWQTQIWIQSPTRSCITARSTELLCVTLFVPWIEQRTTPKCPTCLNSSFTPLAWRGRQLSVSIIVNTAVQCHGTDICRKLNRHSCLLRFPLTSSILQNLIHWNLL